jgi:hypothetical protein
MGGGSSKERRRCLRGGEKEKRDLGGEAVLMAAPLVSARRPGMILASIVARPVIRQRTAAFLHATTGKPMSHKQRRSTLLCSWCTGALSCGKKQGRRRKVQAFPFLGQLALPSSTSTSQAPTPSSALVPRHWRHPPHDRVVRVLLRARLHRLRLRQVRGHLHHGDQGHELRPLHC